jgi:hypothetical protein
LLHDFPPNREFLACLPLLDTNLFTVVLTFVSDTSIGLGSRYVRDILVVPSNRLGDTIPWTSRTRAVVVQTASLQLFKRGVDLVPHVHKTLVRGPSKRSI